MQLFHGRKIITRRTVTLFRRFSFIWFRTEINGLQKISWPTMVIINTNLVFMFKRCNYCLINKLNNESVKNSHNGLKNTIISERLTVLEQLFDDCANIIMVWEYRDFLIMLFERQFLNRMDEFFSVQVTGFLI